MLVVLFFDESDEWWNLPRENGKRESDIRTDSTAGVATDGFGRDSREEGKREGDRDGDDFNKDAQGSRQLDGLPDAIDLTIELPNHQLKHTILSTDTLADIAKMYDARVEWIVDENNNISTDDDLSPIVWQKITVPVINRNRPVLTRPGEAIADNKN